VPADPRPEDGQSRAAAPGLSKRADNPELLPNGVRLVFAPSTEMLSAIAETIDRERLAR
jgi:hypothetical protein